MPAATCKIAACNPALPPLSFIHRITRRLLAHRCRVCCRPPARTEKGVSPDSAKHLVGPVAPGFQVASASDTMTAKPFVEPGHLLEI